VAKLGELAPERDVLAAELRTTFQQAADQLVDLFTRIRNLSSAPAGTSAIRRVVLKCLSASTPA
jgi:hypothetical protein